MHHAWPLVRTAKKRQPGAMASGRGTAPAAYETDGRMTNEQDTDTPTGLAATSGYEAQPSYERAGAVIGVMTTLPQGRDAQVFCYDDLARLTWVDPKRYRQPSRHRRQLQRQLHL